ncbi:LamG domain-containing protein [Actinomadura parmotrematis]|uniref:LamG domain-containing protein n=1 Tax=Actinomadura parmotrematis TaxID=2864039 RepID=A0ABS7FNZ8_9ACTN|nr:LamG domain-containing protein [Actinomadura parmotrematis]MBW8482076.1 LamG domain-containing protein [Actinomadura parmotrematis]
MLVAHWTFDVRDVAGRSVRDAAGGLVAALDEHAGIVPASDGAGTGGELVLDGRGRAVVPAAPRLALSQVFGFTVALAAAPDPAAAPTGEWRGLFYQPVGEDDARALGIWLYPDSFRLRVQLFTVRGPEFVDSRRALAPGAWTRLALVVDRDGMFLYVDGKLDVAAPLEHPVVTPAGPVHLGAEPGRAGFGGRLADVRIYAAALDEDAVRALAEGG